MASFAVLRRLLAGTSLPDDLIEDFLSQTNSLWLLGTPDLEVAGELVLLHPPLAGDEVRAAVMATDEPGTWRITLASADRPGFLARTAGILSNEGLSITHAAGTVLPRSQWCVLRITVTAPRGRRFGDADWERIGAQLRDLHDLRIPLSWNRRGPVVVEAQPQASGRTLLNVEAPDGPGLLHAITDVLVKQGCTVEAYRLGTEDGTAKDVFVVAGPFDPGAFSSAMGAGRMVPTPVLPLPVRLAALWAYGFVYLPWRVAAGVWRQLATPTR